MVNDKAECQSRRRAAQELFDILAADYHDLPGISTARRFGSDGLRMSAKFFAFIGRDGQLIVKLLPRMQLHWLPTTRRTRSGQDETRRVSGSPSQRHRTLQTSTGGEI